MSFESDQLRREGEKLLAKGKRTTDLGRLLLASADEIELRDERIRELEAERPIVFTDIADTEPYRTLLNRPIWGDIDLDELNGNDG